jgi:hypothetical protein
MVRVLTDVALKIVLVGEVIASKRKCHVEDMYMLKKRVLSKTVSLDCVMCLLCMCCRSKPLFYVANSFVARKPSASDDIFQDLNA